MSPRISRTEIEWERELTPEQYRVLRGAGTEPAFTGAYWNHHEGGVYRCERLFESAEKFDSGSGWPSFTAPAATGAVDAREDHSHGMVRTEVLCAACGGHLGHVFPDGPRPTGLRYCINSAALAFHREPPER